MRFKGFVGHSGITGNKREGDGATPAGCWSMFRAFGRAMNPGTRLSYTELTENDFWVDDPESRRYNTMVKGDDPARDWNSAEDLFSHTVAYKYSIVIEYNTHPVKKGLGSAIFLHCSTETPTAGCVSVPEQDMLQLLRFLQPGDIICIADSVDELKKLF